MDKVLRQGKAVNLLDRHIDELALLIVDDVVVADDLFAGLSLAKRELVPHAV